jgi:hypothetical protein
MFGFGPRVEDARQALALLRHYGFNRVGYVGQPTPVMMFFLTVNEPPPAPQPPAQRPPAPGAVPPLALLLPLYQLHVPDPDLTADDQVRFDWHRAEVCHDGNEWKVMAGDHCLGRFADRAEDAQEVLRVVQFYHFTEQCRVRSSGFTYFLVNGAAPRGLMLGARNVEFRRESLTVAQRGRDWYVCDGQRPLFAAGKTADEAREVIQVIHQYQFDHVCQLGDPERPLLTFFIQDHF